MAVNYEEMKGDERLVKRTFYITNPLAQAIRYAAFKRRTSYSKLITAALEREFAAMEKDEQLSKLVERHHGVEANIEAEKAEAFNAEN